MREQPVLALGEFLSNAVTQFRAIHPRQPIPDLSPVSKVHAIPTLELAQRIASIWQQSVWTLPAAISWLQEDTTIAILRHAGPSGAAARRKVVTAFHTAARARVVKFCLKRSNSSWRSMEVRRPRRPSVVEAFAIG